MFASMSKWNAPLGKMEYISPPNIGMDIQEWLQDEEDRRHKRNIKNRPLSKEEGSWVKDRGRGKMNLWVSVAIGLSTRLIHCSLLSLVMLKTGEKDKKLHICTTYVAGLDNKKEGKPPKE